MESEQEKKAADAAAFWLLSEVGIRGEWARLKDRSFSGGRIRRGVWYRIRSHDAEQRTLCLQVNDGEENVNIVCLTVRADFPEKTIVYSDGKWATRPPAEMTYVAVCPKGHEYELGTAPPRERLCACSECKTEYEWEYEHQGKDRGGNSE